ncbi:MAG: cysteine peptidase family C39 domain-containing protein, partial [Deltaproteobacteria bacterium]
MGARSALSRPGKRTRTPTVLQMEAVECGAAALAIVLGYYGRIVSLEELRVACGVSRDGTKASNILKAARAYGLKAKGFSKQPFELPDLPAPMVVFWNFNHFVVVEGFARGKVYLNDPAMGPRTVTDAEFGESFTGVVLVFEPGGEFQPGGVRRGLLGPLRERLRGSQGSLIYVLAGSLMLAAIGLAIPLQVRAFVDYCVVADRKNWAGPLLLGIALAALLRGGLTWLQRRYLLRLETKLALTSSYRYFHHVLRLPIEFFTQRYGGEVGNRVEINDHIAGLLSGKLAANFLNLVMALCYLALMFSFDVVLTLIGSAIAALNLLALQYVSRGRQDINMRLLHEQGKMLGTSMAGLQSIETL